MVDKIQKIALRGSLHQAPENTVPAIKKAISEKADVIFLDVQGASDGVPLVFADTRLDRTTNGTGRIAKMTAEQVQALDAGAWKGQEFQGTKVPTLEEALKAVGAKARVFLMLPQIRKGDALAESLVKVLKARKKPADDVLAFSDSGSLEAFREMAPDFGYALILDEKVDSWVLLKKAERLGLKLVRPHRQQISGEFVRKAHEQKVAVWAHFADEESDLKELLEMKVDGIVTGRLPRLTRVLEELKA